MNQNKKFILSQMEITLFNSSKIDQTLNSFNRNPYYSSVYIKIDLINKNIKIQNMSSSLESQVLFALWALYQQNQISMEQKGCIKDLLIRRDYNLYSAICNCKKLEQLEEKLLDILNCIDLQILF
ncbi:unnamed protein product [Paramecium octaurelia]|uniref:Uncharacterized protein n=1 Tax=Paramecium octaurelia TaxID=43137 RepID=A0A8S1UTJ8_PAROT|nr:unnamed protein product [Paramecium octaurelia]